MESTVKFNYVWTPILKHQAATGNASKETYKVCLKTLKYETIRGLVKMMLMNT